MNNNLEITEWEMVRRPQKRGRTREPYVVVRSCRPIKLVSFIFKLILHPFEYLSLLTHLSVKDFNLPVSN